nr:hypothetical protein [Legionella maceachernii]
MRGFFSYLLIGLLTFGLVINEASAKRFGGGRSFGVQRSYGSLFSSAKAQPMKSLGQQANKSKWGGMLGGLLIGSLLTSLFMGNGLGSGLLSWLILGSIAFLSLTFYVEKCSLDFNRHKRTRLNKIHLTIVQRNFTQEIRVVALLLLIPLGLSRKLFYATLK